MDDDILEQYRLEAAAAMEVEAQRRIAESTDVEMDENLRNTSLHDVEDLVPALLARLGQVRAALDGHGGGIAVTSSEVVAGRSINNKSVRRIFRGPYRTSVISHTPRF